MNPLDRLIPPSLRAAGPDTLRRARLLTLFVLVLVAPGVAFDLLLAWQGNWRIVVPCVISALGVCSVIGVMWVGRSLSVAAHVLLGMMVVGLAGVMAVAGGLTGGAAPTFAVVPLVATLLVDRRAGAWWLGIVALIPLVFLVLDIGWLDFPPPAEGDTFLINQTVGFFTLYISIFGLGAAFDSAWSSAHAVAVAREREVHRLLDHIGQGFLTVTRAGVITGPHSAALESWFGPLVPGQALADYVGTRAPHGAAVLSLEFQALVDGHLPDELILDQMPRRILIEDTIIGLEFRTLPDTTDLLVILSDITAAVAREQIEAVQREMTTVTERAIFDPRGIELLLSESARAMDAVRGGSAQTLRAVHTLKGNMALYGVSTVATLCHALEARLVERAVQGATGLDPAEVRELDAAWNAFHGRASLLVRRREGYLEVARSDVRSLQADIRSSAPAEHLIRTIDGWEEDPAEESLGRLAITARTQAEKLGKAPLDVHIDTDGCRTPASWAPVWAALVHAVTNAVDHGIESPRERRAAGKPEGGALVLSLRADGAFLTIRVADDGAGVRWEAVAEAAARRGLPHATEAELVDALFADRVTTRTTLTEYSGRGVGLAAVRAAVADLGGQTTLRSVPGRGTTLELRLPRESVGEERASA